MLGCGPKKPVNEDVFFQKAVKLLLLGTGESGKTTVTKQMQILHINGFSEEEKKAKIRYIKQNIHESIYDMIYNMGKIHPPEKLVNDDNQDCARFILQLGPEEPSEYLDEYFDHVEKLWKDRGVQATFQRSNEYQLIDSAQHFLDRISEIRQPNYIPTVQDILFCRIRTTSISEICFSVPYSKLYGGGNVHFRMYDVGGQRGERRKWIQVFEGVQAILYVIAASDFDQKLREDETKNRLEEALDVFKDVCGSRFLRRAGMIVFFNKQDIFRRKIEQGRQLGKYIPKYNDYLKPHKSEVERANAFLEKHVVELSAAEVRVKVFNYIKGKVIEEKLPPRRLYIHHTTATDTNNISRVFDDVHRMIIETIFKKDGIL